VTLLLLLAAAAAGVRVLLLVAAAALVLLVALVVCGAVAAGGGTRGFVCGRAACALCLVHLNLKDHRFRLWGSMQEVKETQQSTDSFCEKSSHGH
jgi:hypothetical protein